MTISASVQKWRYFFLVLAIAAPIVVFYFGKDSYLTMFHSQAEGFAKMWVAGSYFVTLIFSTAAYRGFLKDSSESKKKLFAFYLNLIIGFFLFTALILCLVPTDWDKIELARVLHISYFERFAFFVALGMFTIDYLSIKSGATYFQQLPEKTKRLVLVLDFAVVLAVFCTLLVGEVVDGYLVVLPKIKNAEPFTEGFVSGSIVIQVILANVLFARIMEADRQVTATT